jgi:Xaa-Pro aminopeptidase
MASKLTAVAAGEVRERRCRLRGRTDGPVCGNSAAIAGVARGGAGVTTDAGGAAAGWLWLRGGAGMRLLESPVRCVDIVEGFATLQPCGEERGHQAPPQESSLYQPRLPAGFVVREAPSFIMRHAPIGSQVFFQNRERLRAILPPHAVAIVHAADTLPTSADGVRPLHPAPDLFYLSGIEQEESVLVLAPDAAEPSMREMLFVRQPSETRALWDGHSLSTDEATAISGIKKIRWISELPGVLHRLMCNSDVVFLNANEHDRAAVEVESRDERLGRSLMHRYPLQRYERLAPLMHRLRVIKSEAEVELIKRACAITKDGFERVARMLRPGVGEHEVEAEYLHEFTRQKAKMAYNPIVATGGNACVLHYINNDAECRDGELLLVDVGASYANYCADLTRVLPVNGRFTSRQRELYEAVRRVMVSSIERATVGTLHRDWTKAARDHMAEELLALGMITPEDVANATEEKPACFKFFMHGLGHSMGLDVHDVVPREQRFEAGWVLTVEPGLYLPDEGIGIRLENDILVTEQGPVDLMADIPLEADDIEALMASR